MHLANITSYSLEAVFEHIAAHLLRQNKKAATINGCMYRTETGLRCAVGCLIPDSIYEKNFEGRRVASLLKEFDSLPNIPLEYITLLEAMQTLRDNLVVSDWPIVLNYIRSQGVLKAKEIVDKSSYNLLRDTTP